jgi:hypothetical protein
MAERPAALTTRISEDQVDADYCPLQNNQPPLSDAEFLRPDIAATLDHFCGELIQRHVADQDIVPVRHENGTGLLVQRITHYFQIVLMIDRKVSAHMPPGG